MTNSEILQKAIEKYDVTKEGRVFNKKTGKELKPGTYENGYKYICVYVGNYTTKKVKVHRLVAHKYIPNPDNKPHINHIDCDPSNNNVDNLEWCTAKENVIWGFKSGRQQWNKGKKSRSQIIRLCKKYPRKLFWMLTTNNFTLARAFFGEEETPDELLYCDEQGNPNMPLWKYHLREMVLEEDPIRYLKKFL